MLTIKLDRQGVRKKAFYRIVVREKRSKKGGEALDILGFWQPAKKLLDIKRDQVDGWVKKGAQMTASVEKLINQK